MSIIKRLKKTPHCESKRYPSKSLVCEGKKITMKSMKYLETNDRNTVQENTQDIASTEVCGLTCVY